METHSVELGVLPPGYPTCGWEPEVLRLYPAVLDHYIFLENRRLIRTIMPFFFDNQICAVAGTSGHHDVAKMPRNGGWHGTTYHILDAKYIKSMFTHR